MAGRPTKFTRELGEKICKLVAAGVSVEAAAAHERVSKATVYSWREQGLAGKSAFAEFAIELERAQGAIEARLSMNVVARAKDDWRAGAWFLERRMAERFAEQGKLDRKLESEYERVTDVAKQTLDPDSYQRLLRALARPGGSEKA